jgi:hypothetical protein
MRVENQRLCNLALRALCATHMYICNHRGPSCGSQHPEGSTLAIIGPGLLACDKEQRALPGSPMASYTHVHLCVCWGGRAG